MCGHKSYPWISAVAFKLFMFFGDVISLSKNSSAISLSDTWFEVESISTARTLPATRSKENLNPGGSVHLPKLWSEADPLAGVQTPILGGKWLNGSMQV